ncbi:hypothetical protein CAEBREN_15307 [Caenorhabditis brenneri]|uniref:RNA-directed DNA polymerase n=1 Tax=Caenorhabditis brenneri TaxID=135651 RepID=G0P7U7_CAEBE|nr:hypothetical protein CAEBREN_15307 [Caenorhabditis brenneri]
MKDPPLVFAPSAGVPKQTPTSVIPWKQRADITKALDPRIKRFSTGKSSDLNRWLEEYSSTIYRFGIPREYGAQLLPFYLSGDALQKYNRLPQAELGDWEKATELLLKAHDCPADRQIALQELNSIQQGTSTVSSFAEKVKKLGDYVYHNMNEGMKETLLATHFLAGCNPKIKNKIRFLQTMPNTLNGMAAEAEKIVRIMEIEESEENLVAAVQQLNIAKPRKEGNTRGRGGYHQKGNFRGNRGGSQQGGNQEGTQQGANNSESQGEYGFGYHGNGYQNNGFQGNGYQNTGNRGGYNNNGNSQNENRGGYQGYRGQNRGGYRGGRGSQHQCQNCGGHGYQSQTNWYNPNQAHGSYDNTPNTQQEEPRIGWNNQGRPHVINNVGKFLLGIMSVMMLLSTVEASHQICGFGEAGNIFIPPVPTPCNFHGYIPLKTYAVNVYRQRTTAMQMDAQKCFKHEITGEIYSFLKIYRSTEANIGARQAVSPEECRKSAITKEYNGVKLEEVAPGIFRTEQITDSAKNASVFLGSSSFKSYEFTMELGKVATLDGQHVMSTLGSLEKCTFGAGSCQEESATIVWQPQETRRECQFEMVQSSTAVISQDYIAIEEMNIFSKFDTDLRRLQDSLEGCNIFQGYRTDDGYLIEFPEVTVKGWVPDLHIDTSVFGKRSNSWIRWTREVVTMLGPAGTQFETNIGEAFSTPIIRRLFGSSNIEQIADLSNPITEPEILREFGIFNVTNKLLADRARLYPQDRKHPKGRLLMALKAIRTAQYGARQLKLFQRTSRPLTRAEEALKNMIERQNAHIFDKLLEKEFGRSDADSRNMDPSYVAPRFEEEKLTPYKSLAYFEEASWSPPPQTTTTTTSTTTTTRASPMARPTVTTQASTSRPATTTIGQPNPAREMGHVPQNNRHVVYEATTEKTTESQRTPHLTETPKRSPFEIFQSTCQEQWKETALFQTLLNIDPTAAVRQLLKRNDVSAKLIGESVLISQCRHVTPDVVHYGRKVNDTCYNLVPVTIKGKLWFQLPGSKDLIGEATKIPCEDRPPAIRFEHNRWVTTGNQEIHPQFLTRPNGREQHQFLLAAPETFHTNLDEEVGVFTGNDREMRNRDEESNRKLKRRLIRDGFLSETWDKMKETAASAGKSAKNVYKIAMDIMKEEVKEAVFSLLTLIAWVVIPIAIIALLVFVAYSYCKFKTHRTVGRRARKRANRAKDALLKYAQAHLINNVEMQNAETFRPVAARYEEEYPIYVINSLRVNSVSAARLPHIDVKMEGKELEALLDTGAAISYMPLSSATGKIDTEIQPQARTANGSAINFLGTIKTVVQIGSFLIPHTLLVSKDGDCPAPMLIGSDMVKKINQLGHELHLNLHKKKLKIGNCTIKINSISGEEKPPIRVRIAKDTIINPRSEAVVSAFLEEYKPEMGNEFIIEDNQWDSDQIYMVARSLVKTNEKGRTQIQIFNPSNTPVKFRLGKPVAFAEKVEEVKSMNNYHVSPEGHWEASLPKFPQERPANYRVSDKVDIAGSDLTDQQKEDLKLIIDFHEKAFVGPDGILGRYSGPIKHRIDLTDESKIPQAKIHRTPLEKRKEVETQVNEMLNQGIIRPTDSPFAAPIVLVRKADKTSWRFTVDFRALNAMTTPVQSVIPNIHEILDLCAGKTLYTTLDFQQGFHQIPVEPLHCQRTAFACHLGAFEYVRMPMGLKGSPGTFQRVMNNLIKEMRARIFVYIDDMVLTSENAVQHLKDVEEVLDKIEKIGMKLRPEKCKFALPEIKFLGFVISKSGIHPNPEKTRAIDEYPTPRTVKEVRAFIGMASFYRRFIANFSKIAAPIMELTKKDKPFEWTTECQDAMTELKKALTTNPILMAPKLGKPFQIEVDSSGKGVGAVLMQAQDTEGKDKRVIAYASRVYTGAEQKYPAIELEALGLTYAVQQFRPYIDGAKTLIITDHSPLKSMLYRKDLFGRMGKFQIVLQEYDIEIEYRPGKQNIVCDTLSRNHPRPNEEKPQNTAICAVADVNNIDFAKAEQEQRTDKKIRETIELIRKYKIQENVLFEKGPENQWIMRLPSDSNYGKTLTWKIHSSIFENAHLGRDRTERKVREVAVWQGMSADIRKVVERCMKCQKNKDTANTRIRAHLGKFPETTAPFQRVHSDYIGPLPETARGNRFIAMFVDAFSKYIIAEAVPDQKADTLCEAFKERVAARFGPPKLLITDQGTNYMSQKFRDLLKKLNCSHNTSSAYHHEANGQVERANATLETMIRQIEDGEN